MPAFAAPWPFQSSTLLLLTILSAPSHALSVSKEAAIGIGVSLGVVCSLAICGFLVLVFSNKRRKRGGAEEGNSQESSVTNAEAIEMYNRTTPKGFNIWQYDHKAHMAKSKARHGEVVMAQEEDGNVGMAT